MCNILRFSNLLFISIVLTFTCASLFSQNATSTTSGSVVAASPNYTITGGKSGSYSDPAKLTIGGSTDGISGDLTLTTVSGMGSGGKIILNGGAGIFLNNTANFASQAIFKGLITSPDNTSLRLKAETDLMLTGGKESGTTGGLATITISKAVTLGAAGGNIIMESGSSSNTSYPSRIELKVSGANFIRLGQINVSSTGALTGVSSISTTGRVIIGTGGFFMSDATWIRTHNEKSIWAGNGGFGADGGLSIGYGGAVSPVGGAIIAGSVGIGTKITANAKLSVKGKILAEEFEITTDVPASDYVFEDEYNLMPLSEVELFINNNKHLPEVPSAKQFKENGYKVGQMDDLLLRKVEELTLYVIELNKQLEATREELAKVKGGN